MNPEGENGGKLSYWQQRASTWVSISVLVGGLASAFILFMLTKVERNSVVSNLTAQEQYFYYLGEGEESN